MKLTEIQMFLERGTDVELKLAYSTLLFGTANLELPRVKRFHKEKSKSL